MAKYVENETYIPSDDLKKIKARLYEKIESMGEAELRIAAKSEESFRDFVADLVKSIAALFGYVVGQVVGVVREIGRGIKAGWQQGYKAGLGD